MCVTIEWSAKSEVKKKERKTSHSLSFSLIDIEGADWTKMLIQVSNNLSSCSAVG